LCRIWKIYELKDCVFVFLLCMCFLLLLYTMNIYIFVGLAILFNYCWFDLLVGWYCCNGHMTAKYRKKCSTDGQIHRAIHQINFEYSIVNCMIWYLKMFSLFLIEITGTFFSKQIKKQQHYIKLLLIHINEVHRLRSWILFMCRRKPAQYPLESHITHSSLTQQQNTAVYGWTCCDQYLYTFLPRAISLWWIVCIPIAL